MRRLHRNISKTRLFWIIIASVVTLLLTVSVQPLRASPLDQHNWAEQCIKGVRLFVNEQPAEAEQLLEAGFTDWEKANFSFESELGECTLALGLIRSSKDDYSGALEAYAVALEVFESSNDLEFQGIALNNIGIVYNAQGEYTNALEVYLHALTIHREVRDKFREGETLNNIGILYHMQKQYVEALWYYDQAIQALEPIRVTLDYEIRSTYVHLLASIYPRLVEVYYKQGLNDQAFYATERDRNRVFLNSIAAGHIQLSDNEANKLLERESEAYGRLQSAQNALTLARVQDPNNSILISDLNTQLEVVEEKHAEISSIIKDRNDHLTSLIPGQSAVPRLPDLQAMLNEQVTLVSYYILGDEGTLAFIISHDSFFVVELPDAKPALLRKAIVELYLSADLTNPHPVPLQNLYNWLVTPLVSHLKTSQVGIIPHQFLHYIPFAGLSTGETYFGEQYTLFSLPQASALKFSQSDSSTQSGSGTLILGSPTSDILESNPLTHAESEVQAVGEVLSAPVYIGEKANELNFRSNAHKARVLHLATYGLYDSINPLDSTIYLSPGDNASQTHENDGFLKVHEIYELELTADLVILSAGQIHIENLSAKDKQSHSDGDEFVGFTNAFFFAGAPTVITSLWIVDSSSTKELMKSFYGHWKAGVNKAKALQSAQAELRAKPQWASPYFWAGFVLHGNPGWETNPSSKLAESTSVTTSTPADASPKSLSQTVSECSRLNEVGTSLQRQSRYTDALKQFQIVLSCYEQANNKIGEGHTHIIIGEVYFVQEDYTSALSSYKKASAIFREAGGWDGEATSLEFMGDVYRIQGHYEEALAAFEQALDVNRKAANLARKATNLNVIGLIHQIQGRHEEALMVFERALAIEREIGRHSEESKNLNGIGIAYLSLGFYDEAQKAVDHSLNINHKMENQIGEATSLKIMGDIYRVQERYEEALDIYQQVLLIMQEIGNQASAGAVLANIGEIHYAHEQYEEALISYQQALEFLQNGSNLTVEATATMLTNIGAIYEMQGQYAESMDAYGQALDIWNRLDNRNGKEAALVGIGKVYLGEGQHYVDQRKYKKALGSYQQALTTMREADERVGEGTSLLSIGKVYDEQKMYQEALDFYRQGLAIMREMKERQGEGTALNNIGRIYQGYERYEEALDVYQQALDIWREADDRQKEATTLSNVALMYREIGQYENALNHLEKMLTITDEINDQVGKWRALNALGVVYRDLGQYNLSLEYHNKALAISEIMEYKAGVAKTFGDIGLVYSDLGQYELALRYLQKALVIRQENDDPTQRPVLLNNLGFVHTNIGRYEQALNYYQQVLAITETTGDRVYQGITLHNIGEVYRFQSQYEQALDYYQQALVLKRETGGQHIGTTLGSIGQILFRAEQFQLALDLFQQELMFARNMSNRNLEGRALNSLGSVYDDLGQHYTALEHFRQSLTIAQTIGSQTGEWTVLSNIGSSYEQVGEISKAITSFQQSINIIESIQSDFRIEELQTSFAVERMLVYEHFIDLLWEQSRFEEAFNYVERASARAFLDQLANGVVDFRADVNSDLLDREQKLRAEITARRTRLVTLRNRPINDIDTEAIAAAQNILTALEEEHAALIIELKLQSPEVASLISVDVASLADIQAMLDPSVTLVKYFVSETRTLAFIITRDTFDTIALNIDRTNLIETITVLHDIGILYDSHPTDLQQLHAWLIAPLEPFLTTTVIGIVPHGILHYLPFAALSDGEQ